MLDVITAHRDDATLDVVCATHRNQFIAGARVFIANVGVTSDPRLTCGQCASDHLPDPLEPPSRTACPTCGRDCTGVFCSLACQDASCSAKPAT